MQTSNMCMIPVFGSVHFAYIFFEKIVHQLEMLWNTYIEKFFALGVLVVPSIWSYTRFLWSSLALIPIFALLSGYLLLGGLIE